MLDISSPAIYIPAIFISLVFFLAVFIAKENKKAGGTPLNTLPYSDEINLSMDYIGTRLHGVLSLSIMKTTFRTGSMTDL